jgi:hypothetical protein
VEKDLPEGGVVSAGTFCLADACQAVASTLLFVLGGESSCEGLDELGVGLSAIGGVIKAPPVKSGSTEEGSG